MKIFSHSHMGGNEALSQAEALELLEALESGSAPLSRGFGTDLRTQILEKLGKNGWTQKVKVDRASKITIASQKNQVGLCIQTSGNMSRMYADLLKLQKMYRDSSISVGVLILPTANAARSLGDNLANSDRLESELRIFRNVIDMPLVVLSFE